MTLYGSVLAEIHDRWFDSIAKAAARHVMTSVGREPLIDVLDLGCGGGILLREVSSGCRRLYGSDISPDMISIAKSRVPSADLKCEGVFDAHLPTVDVITMVGEVLSYASASQRDIASRLRHLFMSMASAIHEGGILVFDVLGTEHDYRGSSFHDNDHWTVRTSVTQENDIVSREIVSFIRRGTMFEKSIERHDLRCFDGGVLESLLTSAGFRVTRLAAYDDVEVLPGRLAFECRKVG